MRNHPRLLSVAIVVALAAVSARDAGAGDQVLGPLVNQCLGEPVVLFGPPNAQCPPVAHGFPVGSTFRAYNVPWLAVVNHVIVEVSGPDGTVIGYMEMEPAPAGNRGLCVHRPGGAPIEGSSGDFAACRARCREPGASLAGTGRINTPTVPGNYAFVRRACSDLPGHLNDPVGGRVCNPRFTGANALGYRWGPGICRMNDGLVNFGRGCRDFGNAAGRRLANCNPQGLDQMGAGGACLMIGGGLTIDGLNRCTDEANPNNQHWGIVEATGGSYVAVAGGGMLLTGGGTLIGSGTLVTAGGTVFAAAPPVAACVLVGTTTYVATRQVDNATGGRISGGIAVGMCGVGDFFANVCYRCWTDDGGNWDLTRTMAEDCGRGWDPGGTPRQQLRGPGQCGGGNVRAGGFDPPYEEGDDDDLGGCALGRRTGGAAWVIVMGLVALVLRRRRVR